MTRIDHQMMANAIRALSMDAVQQANSGHPGMPMGMADVATVLFGKFLKFDPDWPDWPDRDRFVLSAGHGSMLLYSLLYLTGYERPTLDDIKNFRQLGSPCAGHPEVTELAGVETTTGPLGQGLAMSVGMAIAERLEAARSGTDICDHYTYVLAGDGDLMEGVSHEAISLAGHLKLSKLIVLFDDNHVSIDGPTELAVSDDQAGRFAACGWHVQKIDGHDPAVVEAAIEEARASDKPSLIACRTTIGFGAPTKQGTAATHGAPLGTDEVAATREAIGWPYPAFEIPDDVREAWRRVGQRSKDLSQAWQDRFEALPRDSHDDFLRRQRGDLPAGLGQAIADLKRGLVDEPRKIATRKASQAVLEAVNGVVPETIGGSADLSGSNNTKTRDMDVVEAGDFSGRYIHYGVREFGMAAAMNGMALHRGFVPYGGTFLVFTDYARPAIRLSALMKQRVIYVMTHDSIGLGEDGPTHQPVEHLAALRAMPNLHVYRPADAVETAECWELALNRTEGPSVLALTRQGLEQVRLEHGQDNLCAGGAYVLREASANPRAVLVATGSEVEIAVEARARLEDDGIPCRVVSAPCLERLADRGAEALEVLFPAGAVRAAIEAAAPFGWDRLVGADGAVIGIREFGHSAPYKDLYKHFGITADAAVEAVKARL